MTSNKNTQDQKTNASVTELEESDLQDIEGGYLKRNNCNEKGYTENDSKGKGSGLVGGRLESGGDVRLKSGGDVRIDK